jgi:uncharacterized membrane protein YphA (DoxX/SURF4 family)
MRRRLLLILRVVLAAVFLYAAYSKLTEPSQFGTSDAGKPFAFSKRSLKVSTTF